MRWMLLTMLLTIGCDAARISAYCTESCSHVCREADEAWQNDYDKNDSCMECYRECRRTR